MPQTKKETFPNLVQQSSRFYGTLLQNICLLVNLVTKMTNVVSLVIKKTNVIEELELA